MRMEPADVPPIVHEGIRYEAPHFEVADCESAPELSLRERMLQALHRAAMQAGGEAPPTLLQDEGWCRQQLEHAGFRPDEIASLGEHLAIERAMGEVIRNSVQELLMKAMASGQGLTDFNPLTAISAEWLLEALEKHGTLSSAQREQAVANWQASQRSMRAALQMPARQGGLLVAYDCESGRWLWSLQVFQSDEVFIRSLGVEGDFVVVRDEQQRLYRIDPQTRQVIA